MSQTFLVEVGTEELPPNSLKKLSNAFCAAIKKQLSDKGLRIDAIKPFATPRRLAAVIEQLPVTTPTQEVLVWGPPTRIAFDDQGQPTKAALAFAQKNGIEPAQLETENDGKVDKLICRTQSGGESTSSLLVDIVNQALNDLPVAKRMRWGSSREEFVRPIHWAAMLLGKTVVDGKVLGLTTGNISRGHRFHCQGELIIKDAKQYETVLAEQGHIIADYNKRKELIREQVTAEGIRLGGHARIDEDLLDEVCSLVEWPVALGGKFEQRFLNVPAEALISSMKEHQKYFHVVDDNNELLPFFITVSNIVSKEPQKIIAGNEKVIRPRLSDAAFFFNEDKKESLENRLDKLKTVVFQTKLGSLFDKTQRIKKLSEFIAQALGADLDIARRAAELCKTDLVTSMVYEFPELQGIAGSYYALNDGEPSEVATALKEQYLPKFSGDQLAQTMAGNIVGLADRIDTLVGIFGLGQKPTGSKDPFALRRASLSILRILVEKSFDLDLKVLIVQAYQNYTDLPAGEKSIEHSLAYILDRFKAWYEEQSVSAEVFQAVAAKKLTRPIDIDLRIKAVSEFTQLAEAQALAAANKRVSNILAKQGITSELSVDKTKLNEPAEIALAQKLIEVKQVAEPLFAKRDYTAGLKSLAALQTCVDTFFDDVLVMAGDQTIRNNRLALLQQLRALFLEVADISLLDNSK